MERLLIAVDCQRECGRVFEYLARVLRANRNCELVLFHILPTASPDKMRMDSVHRIELIHASRPDLGGYFWKDEDERAMERCFAAGKEVLVGGGIPHESISTHFVVESGDLADLILQKAADLACSTIVLGRRRVSRMKEILLGSVSSTVLRLARNTSVWVLDG